MRIHATAKVKKKLAYAIKLETGCKRNTAFLLRQRGWVVVPEKEAQKLFDAGYALEAPSDPTKKKLTMVEHLPPQTGMETPPPETSVTEGTTDDAEPTPEPAEEAEAEGEEAPEAEVEAADEDERND